MQLGSPRMKLGSNFSGARRMNTRACLPQFSQNIRLFTLPRSLCDHGMISRKLACAVVARRDLTV